MQRIRELLIKVFFDDHSAMLSDGLKKHLGSEDAAAEVLTGGPSDIEVTMTGPADPEGSALEEDIQQKTAMFLQELTIKNF